MVFKPIYKRHVNIELYKWFLKTRWDDKGNKYRRREEDQIQSALLYHWFWNYKIVPTQLIHQRAFLTQHGFHICLFVISSTRNMVNRRKLYPLETSDVEIHKHTHSSNIYQLLQLKTCVTIHSYLYLMWRFSFWFQITLLLSLHNNSKAVIPLISTSTSKLKDFFKVYDRYIVVFKYWTLLYRSFLLGSYLIFYMSLTKFLSSVILTQISHKYFAFNYVIWHNMGFLETYLSHYGRTDCFYRWGPPTLRGWRIRSLET